MMHDMRELSFTLAAVAALSISAVLLGLLLWLALMMPAHGRDNGQWDATPADIGAWFNRQMLPDNPYQRCCGEADGYYADSFFVSTEKGKDGRVFAIITDDRDDAPLGRRHVENGTMIEVPAHKFKDSRADPNPSGHGVIFLNVNHQVLCYVAPSGA